MKLDDQELATLWIASFRYYCGRMTASVWGFCNQLIRHWPSIPHEARELIRVELRAEVRLDNASRATESKHHPLGMDCDRDDWLRVLRHIEGKGK